MRIYTLLLLLLIGLETLLPPVGLAQNATSASVVSLRVGSQLTPSCGSGFLLKGNQLVTTAHLAQRLCGVSRCPKLTIDTFLEEKGMSVKRALFRGDGINVQFIDAFDIAMIQLATPISTVSPATISSIEPLRTGLPITVVGVHRCEAARALGGTITTLSSTHLTVSAKGHKGSSGSPIVDSNGQVIGMVTEASSLSGAIAESVLGMPFRLKGVSASLLAALLDTNKEIALRSEAEAILSIYRQEVLTTRGVQRLWRSDRFLTQVYHHAVRVVSHQSQKPQFSILPYLKMYPAKGVTALLGDLSELSEVEREQHLPEASLGILSMLESNGFTTRALQPTTPRAITQAISSHEAISDAQKKYLTALITAFEESKHPGNSALSLVWIVIFLTLLTIWALTVGYTWGRSGVIRSRLYQIWMTTLVAFGFWPISFLFFLLRARKRGL